MVATRSRSQMSSQDGGSEQQGNAEHLEGEVQSHRRTRGSGTGASQAAATRRTTRAALHAIPEQDEAAAGSQEPAGSLHLDLDTQPASQDTVEVPTDSQQAARVTRRSSSRLASSQPAATPPASQEAPAPSKPAARSTRKKAASTDDAAEEDGQQAEHAAEEPAAEEAAAGPGSQQMHQAADTPAKRATRGRASASQAAPGSTAKAGGRTRRRTQDQQASQQEEEQGHAGLELELPATQEVQQGGEQHGSSSDEEQQQQEQQQQVQAQRHAGAGKAAAARAAPAARAAAPAAQTAAGSSSDEDDLDFDFDSDGEEDFDSSSMLDSLAASIRAAMGSKAGNSTQQAAAAAAAAAADDASDDAPGAGSDEEIEEIEWQPDASLITSSSAAGKKGKKGELDLGQAAAKAGPLAKQLRAPHLDLARAAKQEGQHKDKAAETAGRKWYDLPATTITDEVKRDLRLLRLRSAFDPKQHYKSFDETKFPKYFQIGQVVDNPLDFYGGRLSGKERKATLTEQLLADADISYQRKRRYTKLQAEATKYSGAKRRKTDMPRDKKKKPRAKH